jgi:Voltage-dependent anion channel
MVYLWILIFLIVCMISVFTFKKIYIRTSTMAIVMAIGVVTQGVLLNYFGVQFFQHVFGKILCMINLALWVSFIFSFFIASLDGKFKNIHYSNVINRFGIGTWVAGTSICGILFYKQFPNWGLISIIIAFINIVLWLIYIGISIKTFIEITRTKSFQNVHGILLLTTVSTQSIVLLLNTVFRDFPDSINLSLLFLGFSFYLVCVFFILFRYIKNTWSIERDWNNTNCILHGALSISGVACFITGIISIDIIRWIWRAALIIFIVVEAIELLRLFRRIKQYGYREGIFIYDVTQWSRVFTFAMFYTFTSLIHTRLFIGSYVINTILNSGVWVVIILLMIELILTSSNTIKTFKQSSRKLDRGHGVSL